MTQIQIDRKQIISALKDSLEKNSSVTAFWLEGADATGHVDEYSDIDAWLDVLDGQEEHVISQVRRTLSDLSPLDLDIDPRHPHPDIRQIFLHMRDSSKYLILDLCIQSHSRSFHFTRGHKDELIVMVFDKNQTIKYHDLDEESLRAALRDRVSHITTMHPIHKLWVEKAVNLRDFLESLHAYHQWILEPLVELLRIRYEPTKRSFSLKHIRRDLPKTVVNQLERLYETRAMADIEIGMKVAEELFLSTVHTLHANVVIEQPDNQNGEIRKRERAHNLGSY